MEELQKFNFNGVEVRTQQVDNEVWFVAKDVANILEYPKTDTMTRRLDEDEKDTRKCSTLGGSQELTVINESGLYNAILGSNKPQAKVFKKWVTGEVLPQIRKTGSYGYAERERTMLATLSVEMEKRIRAEMEAERYRKNLEALARVSSTDFGSISKATGLPKDMVVGAYCKSSRKDHQPQQQKYIQLILPMQELITAIIFK